MLEMREKADRALRIVRLLDSNEYERAKSYWYAHIVTNIGDDHGYCCREMCTMDDSFAAIKEADAKQINEEENEE